MAEKRIGDRTFRAEKLPARAALNLQLRLAKVLGPAFARLAEIVKIEDEAERDARTLEALGSFLAATDADEVERLVVELSEKARVSVGTGGAYEPVIFDHHFSDDLLTAWQVAMFVVQVNFADFFGGVSRLAPTMISRLSPSARPAASPRT